MKVLVDASFYRLMLRLVFLLLVMAETKAACFTHHGPNRSQDIDINLGRIVIRPEHQVGEVLASRSYFVTPIRRAWRCDSSGGNILARIVQPGMIQDNILATNIPGIGLRFQLQQRGRSDLGGYYPYNIRLNNSGQEQLHALGISEFRVEVVKTAALSGSGPVRSGVYTNLYAENSIDAPTLVTRINPQGMHVISAACSVSSGSENLLVRLPKLGSNALKSRGETAGSTLFSISVNCVGGIGGNVANSIGVGSVGLANIQLRFDYDEQFGAADGLIRTKRGRNAARGIAIQLLDADNTNPIDNNDAIFLGHVRAEQRNRLSLNLIAQYYALRSRVSPGKVAATAVFTIEYD